MNNDPRYQQQTPPPGYFAPPPATPNLYHGQPQYPPPQRSGCKAALTRRVSVPIWLIIVVALLVVCSCSGLMANQQQTTSTVRTPDNVTSQPQTPVTGNPTLAPSPAPTHIEPVGVGSIPTYGPVYIGAAVSNFAGKYGKPSVNTDVDVEFNSAGYLVSVMPDFYDSGTYKSRALTVAAYAPKGTLWTSKQSKAVCNQFLPADSVLRKVTQQVDNGGNVFGTDFLYYSASLVSKFKPEQFQDQQQNPTTPGLFNVMYWFDTINGVSGIHECLVEPGTDVASA